MFRKGRFERVEDSQSWHTLTSFVDMGSQRPIHASKLEPDAVFNQNTVEMTTYTRLWSERVQ